MPRKARSFFLLSLDASSTCTPITLESLTVLKQIRSRGQDQAVLSTKQRTGERNRDEQIKGFVPIWTEGLFDSCRRCDVHVVHTEVCDWIGQTEDVSFDESVRGNDCTVLMVSKS
jgi:hypothetical protein